MSVATPDKLTNQFAVSTSIFVRFQKEGIHKYPDAPEEVSYLRFPHRHIFHFEVSVEVFHNDRELEFIMFSNWLQSQLGSEALSLDYKSCEMLADDIATLIVNKYGARSMTISVSEDNENGAVKFYHPYEQVKHNGKEFQADR